MPKSRSHHCWGCGVRIDLEDAITVRTHHYCSSTCAGHAGRNASGYPFEPVDWDEQDRRAAAEERIAAHWLER